MPIKTGLDCRKGFAHTNHSSGNSCKSKIGKGLRPHQPQLWKFLWKPAWAAQGEYPSHHSGLVFEAWTNRLFMATQNVLIQVKSNLGCIKGFIRRSGNPCENQPWLQKRLRPCQAQLWEFLVKTSLGCGKGFAHTNHSSGNSCKNQPGLQKAVRPHQPQLWKRLWKPA